MKRNGTEYIEPGLGGHPRFRRDARGGGAVAVNEACNAFFERRGLPRSEATFQEQKRKTK
jgi:hypothetical protein